MVAKFKNKALNYRNMKREEELKALEGELIKTKYNKRTERAIGILKAKIATLRETIDKERQKSKRHGKGFSIKKTGDATVVLVGFPSVGKSTLLNLLTNAKSKIASYDFTTIDSIPGIMNYEGAKIRIVDIPGIIIGAASGSGRGREVLSAVRVADLIIIVLTPDNYKILKQITHELESVGIRLNKRKKDIRIKKKPFGGISIATTKKLDIKKETLKSVLREFKITNADVLIRDHISLEDFIDAVQSNVVYIPGIFIINKVDQIKKEELNKIKEELKNQGYKILGISAEKNINISTLKEEIFKKLKLMRIYLKEANKKTDDKPMILKEGETVKDLCKRIHKDFVRKFRFARVWGSSKFPGEKVGLNYKLKDKDIIQIHLR